MWGWGDWSPTEGREDADNSREEREAGPWQERMESEENQSPESKTKAWQFSGESELGRGLSPLSHPRGRGTGGGTQAPLSSFLCPAHLAFGEFPPSRESVHPCKGANFMSFGPKLLLFPPWCQNVCPLWDPRETFRFASSKAENCL